MMIIKPFMRVYVGTEFISAWRYVPILLASASFSAVASYFGSLYGALKLSMRNMVSTLIAAILNIIFNYVCIYFIGVWGALIGTLVAYGSLAFIRMIDVLQFIKFNPRWGRFIKNVFIVITQAILVSMDYHVYIVSIILIIIFFTINFDTIKKIIMGMITIYKN